jgi:hypothetical protein
MRLRIGDALPCTRRPSSATRPSFTSPASMHSSSTSVNSPHSAAMCWLRKPEIVRWSGRWFAARKRKPTSVSRSISMRRALVIPFVYACSSTFTIIAG